VAASPTPSFAIVPRAAVAAVSTANTNRDGTGTIVDIITGVAAGTKITSIALQATGDPADSIVTIFLHNGTSYFLYDEVDLGNPAAASTTVSGNRVTRSYSDLVLPSASWKLAAAITVALTAGVINVFAFGADLT
jgi:hypothetical protein